MITSIENFVTRRAAAPVPGFLQPETTTEAARLVWGPGGGRRPRSQSYSTNSSSVAAPAAPKA